MTTATARAHPNIAFIKYWGNRDEKLRLPANASISMNLAELYTETTVSWSENGEIDTLKLNGLPQPEGAAALDRVRQHLSDLRSRLGIQGVAHVESSNSFPTGAGIASSASAFAALTVAACHAANLKLSERELSTLARLGSGSASRSIPAGFVEWHMGESHETSFAETFADMEQWNLVDVIAVVNSDHKAVTSRAGHISANTSELQSARVAGANQRLQTVKQALMERDFTTFAEVVEHDSNLMHAVMMTSRPALFYWRPESLTIMQRVREWRQEGLNVCYTLDAGPNVHCICEEAYADAINSRLQAITGVEKTFVARPGPGARIINVV